MRNITIGSIGDNFAIFDGENVGEYHGQEMQSFFSEYFLNDAKKDTAIIWMHRLSVYIEDIIYILHHIGYVDVSDYMPAVSDMKSHDYQYLLSDDGTAYRMIIKVQHKTTYIYNSDNLLSNISEQEIIKAFAADVKRKSELEKLVRGMWKAVFLLKGFQAKKTPFTLPMYASRDWRATENLYFCKNLVNAREIYIGRNSELRLDEWLRKSYHGGWCYMNENGNFNKAREKGGLVYDVNSLYPFIMSTRPMPWGMPVYHYGEIPAEIMKDKYKYYFIHIKCRFELKEGKHFPFIVKKDSMYYWGRDYLETSDVISADGKRVKNIITREGERVPVVCELTLSKTDYEMMLRHYNVYDVEYIDGVSFNTCRHVFDSFVKKHYETKMEATRTRDLGRRHISKITMNAVSGTLAKRAERTNLILNFDENDEIKYDITDSVIDTPSYIYLASAILSYAREYVIEAACDNYDRFLYSDTDSLHLCGKESAEMIDKDPEKLGYWKLETVFDDAVYIKRKTYILKTQGRFKLVFAGVDKRARAIIEDAMSTVDFEANPFNVVEGKKRISDLPEELKQCDLFDSTKPDSISFNAFMDTLRNRENLGEEYDPMYMMMYADFPTFIEWSENFELKREIKWNRIKI